MDNKMKTYSVKQIMEVEWIVDAEDEEGAIKAMELLSVEHADDIDHLVYGTTNDIYKVTQLESDLRIEELL